MPSGAPFLPSSEPPAETWDDLDERGSVRRLDDVGVEAVLGAMIEQRRRARHPAVSRPPPAFLKAR